MTQEEAIRTYIQYGGSTQGLITDFCDSTYRLIRQFIVQLNANMFNPFGEKPNMLSIRCEFVSGRGEKFTIYHTDAAMRPEGPVFVYYTAREATEKFLQLYYNENPTYRMVFDKEKGFVKTRITYNKNNQ